MLPHKSYTVAQQHALMLPAMSYTVQQKQAEHKAPTGIVMVPSAVISGHEQSGAPAVPALAASAARTAPSAMFPCV